MDFSGIFSVIGGYLFSGLVFIVIFSLLIILHEFGHFWAARRAGIKVLEFGFGLPPKIWGKKTKKRVKYCDEEGNKKTRDEEMEWTINAIPFGGFVRMEGEEEKSDSPTAFGNRPLGWKILVVCGGVIMNFLLGWFLFTLAFGFGMNPLMPTLEQRDEYAQQGFFEKYEDAFLITFLPKGLEGDSGLRIMDMPIQVDGHRVSSPSDFILFYKAALASEKKEVEIIVQRFELSSQQFEEKIILLPLGDNSAFTQYSPKVEISKVLKSSPAAAVNIKKGDIILTLEQANITSAEQFSDAVTRFHNKGLKSVRVSVQRDNEERSRVFVVPLTEEGKMGIELQDSLSELEKEKIVLDIQTIYLPVKKVSYPWTEAPQKAFLESVRWLGISFDMITNVFTSLLFSFEIPDGIGGPVAIADTTNKLVDHGDFSKILQFTAILSLSLAVINIMPFPGLDGGRLFFLIAEGIMRFFAQLLSWFGIRKTSLPTQLPEKYEMPLHAIGYIILLGLIAWITWKDVVRIFF